MVRECTFGHPMTKSEAEVERIRMGCLDRWLGVLRHWNTECSKSFDPQEMVEVDSAVPTAALRLRLRLEIALCSSRLTER